MQNRRDQGQRTFLGCFLSWCSTSLDPVFDVPIVWIQFLMFHQSGTSSVIGGTVMGEKKLPWKCVDLFQASQQVRKLCDHFFYTFPVFAILGTLPPPTGPEEQELNWFHRSGPTFFQLSTAFQFLIAKKLRWKQHKNASLYFLFCSVSSWKSFCLVCSALLC